MGALLLMTSELLFWTSYLTTQSFSAEIALFISGDSFIRFVWGAADSRSRSLGWFFALRPNFKLFYSSAVFLLSPMQ
jgi:hypothetical protein